MFSYIDIVKLNRLPSHLSNEIDCGSHSIFRHEKKSYLLHEVPETNWQSWFVLQDFPSADGASRRVGTWWIKWKLSFIKHVFRNLYSFSLATPHKKREEKKALRNGRTERRGKLVWRERRRKVKVIHANACLKCFMTSVQIISKQLKERKIVNHSHAFLHLSPSFVPFWPCWNASQRLCN